MHTGRTVFAQVMEFLPLPEFRACVARYQVELFFKWIKQHLRITAFYGTSENAVKTQACITVAVYVVVAILKKRLGLSQSLLHNSPGPECRLVRESALIKRLR